MTYKTKEKVQKMFKQYHDKMFGFVKKMQLSQSSMTEQEEKKQEIETNE